MNITESNHASLLLRALQGDPNIDAEKVAESAHFIQGRVHDALKAAPALDHTLLMSAVLTLQVTFGGPNFDGSLDGQDKATPDRGLKVAGRKQSRAARAADKAEQTKAEAKAAVETLPKDGQKAYAERVQGQRQAAAAG